jgi:prepilin-type N-terminal cleavage/methylation domain-containing protein
MDMNHHIQHPASNIEHHRRAFTLVELLVVITIIGILASLIVTAAIGAMGKAQDTRIKAEINEVANALDEYKNKTTAYPPNLQTNFGSEHDPLTPAQKTQVFNDLKKHMKQAFPRHQESDELLLRLAGLSTNLAGGKQLDGGMTAGEALVFWLGGFSSDPKYPISGEGGPSYLASDANQDPIESRSFVFPFEVTRLGPRDEDKYFDSDRYVTYPDPRVPNDSSRTRRINFWQYFPRNQEESYVYLDTSRYSPDVFDPPAAPGVHVHALKHIENPGSPSERVLFVNPDKFQVLHCGRDDEWGEDFDRTSYEQYLTSAADFLTFPEGPFIGEMSDTIVNFTEQTKIEDAQP